MEKKNEAAEAEVLLRQMAATQKRAERSSLVTTIAVIILAAAVIVSLAVLVPPALNAVNEARVTMQNTQELVRQAGSSLEKLDSMTESVNAVMKEGGENVSRIADALSSSDLSALGGAIQKLNGLVESLSNFRLFG
jgi:predicted PurR-regulated permease PerM